MIKYNLKSHVVEDGNGRDCQQILVVEMYADCMYLKTYVKMSPGLASGSP